LILDGANANIDTLKENYLQNVTEFDVFRTEAIIEKTYRERFPTCTVLTIAHRLETVMDSDRILVLDEGRINKFETPSKLLSTQNSFLSQLVQRPGAENGTK